MFCNLLFCPFVSIRLTSLHALQKLAIKRMNLQATKEFMAELQVLTHVHHTNLVRFKCSFCEPSLIRQILINSKSVARDVWQVRQSICWCFGISKAELL